MRGPSAAALILGLALWSAHGCAAPAEPRYSSNALYNLANSYARAGRPGMAVLNYERAALLAPNDADITANLDYVRAFAHVPSEPRTLLQALTNAVSPTAVAWAGVFGIFCFGIGAVASRLTRRFRFARAAAMLLGVALFGLALCEAGSLWPKMREAVVLVDQTPVRVSPVPMGETAFVLAEAESVMIRAEHEGFMLIRTRSGLFGWVSRANLAAVVPSDD